MNTAENEPLCIRKRELARLLNVSPRTIDNWVARRLIPVIAVTPRLHLFDPAKVKAALEEKFEAEKAESVAQQTVLAARARFNQAASKPE